MSDQDRKSNGHPQGGASTEANIANLQDPPLRDALDSVPDCDRHEEAPCHPDQIAWQYLAPEKRMRRWTETIEIFDLHRSQREIAIDFTLPTAAGKTQWMMPTAYLGKTPVAPDLEVRDASGMAISIPTKRENMAITEKALDALDKAGVISLSADPDLRKLCHEVIREANFEARVARLLAESRFGTGNDLLRGLLRALEDQFLLWVPVTGQPGCDQQIHIRRRQGLHTNVVLRPKRIKDERTVETAVGPVPISFLAATSRRRPNFKAIVGRVLRIFGLAAFEYEHETTEPHRFASFHLRVKAPDGLIVRDVAARVRTATAAGTALTGLRTAPASKPGLTYQGRESDLAHFHCAESRNPAVLRAYTTLGIRGGLTTPWAGAAVFTALLLWAVHRLAPANLAAGEAGHLEATVAVLLIGPALASAWALRADRGDLLESTLGGSRALLLLAAVLSVGVALSLAGFQPFRWSNQTAVEVYASISYGVAALMVVSWALTSPACWFLYREVLNSARRNYAALFLTAALAGAICVHDQLPVRLVGIVLLGCGLVMAAIGARPGRSTDTDAAGPYSAAVGAFVTLLGGGWFLGFYEELSSRPVVQLAVLASEGVLLVIAAVQWYRS